MMPRANQICVCMSGKLLTPVVQSYTCVGFYSDSLGYIFTTLLPIRDLT